MLDDDAARRALQALADEPTPPVTTTLDQVLRRGKRRLLIQRAGSVAAVVAVVAAIGIGVMLMRPGDDSGGVQVGDVPVSTTVQPTTPPLPGWAPVDLPVTSDGSCAPATQELGRGNVALPSKQQTETAFVGAVESTLDSTSSPLLLKTYESPRASVVVEVGVGNGAGQVQLEIVTYGGTPEEAADEAITLDVPCLRPSRRVLADGTVLQLHQADAKGPTQKLRVYRPDGVMYTITSSGSGRGELPMTDTQLATTAEELVKRMEE